MKKLKFFNILFKNFILTKKEIINKISNETDFFIYNDKNTNNNIFCFIFSYYFLLFIKIYDMFFYLKNNKIIILKLLEIKKYMSFINNNFILLRSKNKLYYLNNNLYLMFIFWEKYIANIKENLPQIDFDFFEDSYIFSIYFINSINIYSNNDLNNKKEKIKSLLLKNHFIYNVNIEIINKDISELYLRNYINKICSKNLKIILIYLDNNNKLLYTLDIFNKNNTNMYNECIFFYYNDYEIKNLSNKSITYKCIIIKKENVYQDKSKINIDKEYLNIFFFDVSGSMVYYEDMYKKLYDKIKEEKSKNPNKKIIIALFAYDLDILYDCFYRDINLDGYPWDNYEIFMNWIEQQKSYKKSNRIYSIIFFLLMIYDSLEDFFNQVTNINNFNKNKIYYEYNNEIINLYHSNVQFYNIVNNLITEESDINDIKIFEDKLKRNIYKIEYFDDYFDFLKTFGINQFNNEEEKLFMLENYYDISTDPDNLQEEGRTEIITKKKYSKEELLKKFNKINNNSYIKYKYLDDNFKIYKHDDINYNNSIIKYKYENNINDINETIDDKLSDIKNVKEKYKRKINSIDTNKLIVIYMMTDGMIEFDYYFLYIDVLKFLKNKFKNFSFKPIYSFMHDDFFTEKNVHYLLTTSYITYLGNNTNYNNYYNFNDIKTKPISKNYFFEILNDNTIYDIFESKINDIIALLPKKEYRYEKINLSNIYK